MSSTSVKKQAYGFTSALLDDMGLDVYAFRAYHAISRRAGTDGECWESLTGIAERCRMSEKRLRTALIELEHRGLIRKTHRDGYTSIFELAFPRGG
jgi:hypothetical protein